MLLRAATPEDAREVANVHVRSWQVGYRGLIARAERFYRADRWVSDGTGRVAAVHGLTVNEVRYDRHLV
jgi:hypothetical protein